MRTMLRTPSFSTTAAARACSRWPRSLWAPTVPSPSTFEPQALAATAANAELNGCAARIWIGPPEALPAADVDLVLANILAGPLMEHAATFARRLRAGGRVVLSGVLATQRDALLRAYASDFEAFDTAERDGWLRIAARRRSGPPAGP